uniref:NADH-ubiquinone oxidoreductase chain 6 n=1 Tax=Stigmella roborella TaxID=1498834 RepID=A0A076EBQ8_9NEOP|nr:NADH dehydrogenase subunit 6 [Stigmella roborella]
MFKLMISFMLMIFSNIMYFLNNPLSMGLMILLQTLLTCLLSGMLMNTYWFSYILFLTFLGGLLVLFIYVSSISSNEMFKFSMNLNIITMMTIIMSLIMSIYYMNNLFWMNFSFNMEMKPFLENFLFFNNENKINMNKLYNDMNFMMYMLIIYLLISLIAIVKITNIFYGPLRPMY